MGLRESGEQRVRVAAEPEGAVDEESSALGCEPVEGLFEEHGLMTCSG